MQNQIGLSWERGLRMVENVNTSMVKFFPAQEGFVCDFLLRYFVQYIRIYWAEAALKLSDRLD